MKKLHIRVTPNARQSAIQGWEAHPLHGRVLRVRIAAPPAEGKANQEVVAFLAKVLGVGKSHVSLDKGSTSREKTLLVPDVCDWPAAWESAD
jgi:uncharacterized protein (TIGR00251 family)